ncbi:MAG: Uncharacterized protein Athens101428_197 [Candidatus Berkelbacteria bacterium Athens1014_28]|uniref:SWIM-type domain-containing protein n=1 Tax=Candidatus Berkelbacteria bacterium Athens1014_28 TaxID=2017145 RepID=A0A554LP70_9BACT|nr:MAG: Uncharacterized protein Athens101428_197 [Candidatus Berkelbacteria bacterium Athens1014_28]
MCNVLMIKYGTMKPKYDLEEIKFGIDEATWNKAVNLYEKGKVQKLKPTFNGFSAEVVGGSLYNVFVSISDYDVGDCDCYLGQNETLCKHMIAVAIYAIIGGHKLSKEEKELNHQVVCSGKVGELSESEIIKVKADIRDAMKYVKPYNGPSRIWFQYQSFLIEGCNRLAKIVSGLPVCSHTSQLLIDLILRIDKKLTCGGIDDSDGTIGGFIESVVLVLQKFAILDEKCITTFSKLAEKETCFGWEEPLLKIYDANQ